MPAEDLQELLEAAPRANIAFRSCDGIQATPVAFRFQAGRYWIGVRATETGPLLGPGEAVKLLIDEGPLVLRAARAMGPWAHCGRRPGARGRG